MRKHLPLAGPLALWLAQAQAAGFSFAAGLGPDEPLTSSPNNRIEGQYVSVPQSLSSKLAEFEAALARAKQIVHAFARENELSSGTSVDNTRLEVYFSQDKLWRFVNRTPDWSEPPPLPRKTYVAASGNPIRIVSPEEFARLIPEYAALRSDSWARLIAHELAHNWHQEIGGPGAGQLGPIWFVEGLAVVIAGQGFGEDLRAKSTEDALRPIDWSGRYAYASAAAAVRFFLRRATAKALIERARTPDFETWLRGLSRR